MRKQYKILITVFFTAIAIYLGLAYNSLVKNDEKVKQQWAEVQNTYQRRLDLVPNLVNVVKGLAEFEKSTLTRIAELRNQAGKLLTNDALNAQNYSQQRAVQDSLASNLNRVIVIVEQYPDLKGTKAFSDLQTQLEGTERRIRIARNDFNYAINKYNTSVRRFPSSLAAGLFGFERKDGFVADTRENVKINF